jgi:hypothetical protein
LRFSRSLALALAATALAGCGEGEIAGVPDATPSGDGPHRAPACDVAFGTTFIFDEASLMPVGQGFDITGDGVPDNALGFMAPLANQALAATVESGEGIYLTDFVDWNGEADDPDVTMTFYSGEDADVPANPANNRDGDGTFTVSDRQFDVRCLPLSSGPPAPIQDRVYVAQADAWPMLISNIGTIVFADLHTEATFAEDFASYASTFGAVWTACGLARATGPAFGGDTFLDQIVNEFARPEPDIDVDGDGLERFVGDGNGIAECIDGDETVIPGADCACDARIADGYSVSIEIRAVRAEIVGIIETQ